MSVQAMIAAALVALLTAPAAGLLLSPGQSFRDFTAPTPLPYGHTLVLGFAGGREKWHKQHAVRRLALELRALQLLGVHVETVENKKRTLALELVRRAFDRNGDGGLDSSERGGVRLIVYGHSFGGAAIVQLARPLDTLEGPVMLSVQIDSVGRGDAVIPANVAWAANLFQKNGLLIAGEPAIRAADPSRTVIVGNFEFDYHDRRINLAGVPWHKKIFRVAHTRMEHDPVVWSKVRDLILETIGR
ncbi:MAG: hypothetical protein ACR2L2_17470 [Acidobacteriota bacterium]